MGDAEEISMRNCSYNQQTAGSPSSSSLDRSFKAILCGGNGVGKTSIYTRLKYDRFEPGGSSTTAPDECIVNFMSNNNVEVKVNLWDTVGMERYEGLTRSYFTGSHLVLIVYSTDSKDSLNQALLYKNVAMEHAPGCCLVLVRNKIDLSDPEQVSEQEAKRLLNYNDFKYKFKTSAKTGEGIKDIEKTLGAYLHKHSKKVKKKPGTVSLKSSQPKMGCCHKH